MPDVLLTREGGIATLTLNREDKLNAMNEAMGDELNAHCHTLMADPDLRVVVLTGAGRAFSAGGDLDMLAGFQSLNVEEGTKVMRAFYERFLVLRELPVPVIAAIGGHAVGAGVCLTLACDIRIASTKAKIALNFTRLGLHPGCGATYYLPRVVGQPTARHMLMTGRTWTGEQALDLGLVHQAVDHTVFVDTVAEAAKEIERVGPLASRQLKVGMKAWHDEDALERALSHEARSQAECYQTLDFQEGVKAARERRAPAFKNH